MEAGAGAGGGAGGGGGGLAEDAVLLDRWIVSHMDRLLLTTFFFSSSSSSSSLFSSVFPQTDLCISNAVVKTGIGFSAGVVLSVLLFRREWWAEHAARRGGWRWFVGDTSMCEG